MYKSINKLLTTIYVNNYSRSLKKLYIVKK